MSALQSALRVIRAFKSPMPIRSTARRRADDCGDMAKQLADDVDALQRDGVAHHQAQVGRQSVAHRIEQPPGIIELLGEAQAKLVLGRDQRGIDRRRIGEAKRRARRRFCAILGLDRVAAVLGLPKMRGRAEMIVVGRDELGLGIRWLRKNFTSEMEVKSPPPPR